MQKKLKDSVEKAAKHRARVGDQPTTPKLDLQLSLRLPTDRQGVVHKESVVCPAELLINIRVIETTGCISPNSQISFNRNSLSN
jgi:hypothetical protein